MQATLSFADVSKARLKVTIGLSSFGKIRIRIYDLWSLGLRCIIRGFLWITRIIFILGLNLDEDFLKGKKPYFGVSAEEREPMYVQKLLLGPILNSLSTQTACWQASWAHSAGFHPEVRLGNWQPEKMLGEAGGNLHCEKDHGIFTLQ